MLDRGDGVRQDVLASATMSRLCRARVGGRILKSAKTVGISMPQGGVPDLPSPRLRAAAAGRHSPLRLQDRLRRRPSMSEDGRMYSIFVT